VKNLALIVKLAAVARYERFSKAARELGLALSFLTISVAGLEAEMGARLLNRTTRSVTLTDEGRARYGRQC
jgi:LysR family transcriptional regulator, regulator for bpeEF and oprC